MQTLRKPQQKNNKNFPCSKTLAKAMKLLQEN